MIQKEFTSSQIKNLHEIAEEEVNEMFSDAEEIGSSDISICVRNVLETAKREGLEHTDSNFQLTAIRSIVNQELFKYGGSVMTRNQIIKKIGNPHLNLYTGKGYFYFVYDTGNIKDYANHSVYCYRLNDMSLDQWVDEGNGFLKEAV